MRLMEGHAIPIRFGTSTNTLVINNKGSLLYISNGSALEILQNAKEQTIPDILTHTLSDTQLEDLT